VSQEDNKDDATATIHTDGELKSQPENEPTDAELVAEAANIGANSEIDAMQQQVKQANEQLLRVQAEMQNVRRRAERDVENAHKFALEKFATELLSVVDNLERALSAINTEDESQKSVAEGIELTLKTFIDVLAKFNVEAVEPEGQPFDADLHQAVSTVPNSEVEPNTVIDVFQKGYTLNGRLIRPAMVVVSKTA
jgi:molecular chaperone GrpE